MNILSGDFREMLGAEMISVIGGIFAGIMLASFTNKLEMLPGLLILLPGFLEMKGNISGSLAARLSSGLFLGALKPRASVKNRILRGNLIASFLLVIILSVFLGVVAYFVNLLFFGFNSYSIIIVALIAGIISNIIEIPLTVVTTFWLFRKGHDPNNIMGPYITAIGDIVSTIALLIGIFVV